MKSAVPCSSHSLPAAVDVFEAVFPASPLLLLLFVFAPTAVDDVSDLRSFAIGRVCMNDFRLDVVFGFDDVTSLPVPDATVEPPFSMRVSSTDRLLPFFDPLLMSRFGRR